MLACDLILEVRASGVLGAEQVARLERMIFANGEVGPEQLEMLAFVGRYVRKAHPSWALLLERTAAAANAAGPAEAAPRAA